MKKVFLPLSLLTLVMVIAGIQICQTGRWTATRLLDSRKSSTWDCAQSRSFLILCLPLRQADSALRSKKRSCRHSPPFWLQVHRDDHPVSGVLVRA